MNEKKKYDSSQLDEVVEKIHQYMIEERKEDVELLRGIRSILEDYFTITA